jgi:hypothetical protein
MYLNKSKEENLSHWALHIVLQMGIRKGGGVTYNNKIIIKANFKILK